MTIKQYYRALLTVVLSMFVLSLAWEFWWEDLVVELTGGSPEPLSERLEYVLTTLVFVLLSLIYPAILGRRLILEQQAVHDRLARFAEVDYLTGLYNRRKISEYLENELNRFHRYHTEFSVLLLDVDHFKEVNDTFGHSTGDHLLTELANVIRESTRASDIVGRWGGEEFLVICPQTDLTGAARLAEKIRGNIDNREFTNVGSKSASLGVARSVEGDSPDSILRRADAALYTAKRSGRNRVEVAG